MNNKDQYNTRKPKSGIRLTTQDHRLLGLVRTLRCIRQDQLEQLIGRTKKTLRFRLAQLAQHGYLLKVAYGAIGGKYQVGWTVGPLNRGVVPPFTSRQIPELNHQFELVQIYVDLMARQIKDVGLVWCDGISYPIEFGSKKFCPDAVIKIGNKKLTILLEYDRDTKPQARLEEQIRQYREYLFSPCSNKHERLFFVTPSEAEGRFHILKRIAEQVFRGYDISKRVVLTQSYMAASEIEKAAKEFAMVIPLAKEALTPDGFSSIYASEGLVVLQRFLEEVYSDCQKMQRPLPPSYKKAAGIVFRD